MSAESAPWPPVPDAAVAAALAAARRVGEIVSRVTPMTLGAGEWWPRRRVWPAQLAAGVLEPERGYRFGPENAVLGRLLEGRFERVLDLGAGSGSLLLIAAWLTRPRIAVGIERQAQVAERLERTLAAHSRALSATDSDPTEVSAVTGDLRDETCLADVRAALGGPADLVVANPPFFPAGWGRPSKHPDVHASTHALHGTAADFLRAARMLASDDGTAWVLYDAGRVAELLAAADVCGWRVAAMRWLPDRRPGHDHVPFRVWVELGADGAASAWIR